MGITILASRKMMSTNDNHNIIEVVEDDQPQQHHHQLQHQQQDLITSITESPPAIFNLPAPPGGLEGDASFAWLQGSQYWEDFDLPKDPSLRLDEDDQFFYLVRGNQKTKEGSHVRFFHAIPKLPDVRELELEEAIEEQKMKNRPVPLHIRKMEIELTQRQLPRYPSQTHRKKPSFYPIVHSEKEQQHNNDNNTREAKFLAFYRSRLQERKKRLAEREEQKRLRKERREQRLAEKREKRKRSNDTSSKKRSRSRALHDDGGAASGAKSLPHLESMAGISAASTSATSKTTKKTNKSGASNHSSSWVSSMMSSVMSFDWASSDDEDFGDEIGDDEYRNEEMDYFYAEEKEKMQQVHSKNIELADQEARQRRIDAEQKAREAREVQKTSRREDLPRQPSKDSLSKNTHEENPIDGEQNREISDEEYSEVEEIEDGDEAVFEEENEDETQVPMQSSATRR